MVCQRVLGICNLETVASYHGERQQHRSITTELQEASVAEGLSAVPYWEETLPPVRLIW